MVRVKICGICDLATALAAVEAGADALGFVFAESRRRVSPELAREIISQLPPFVASVGVFVDEAVNRVREIAGFCGLDLVQLHGLETPEYCLQVGVPVLKGIQVAQEADLLKIKPFLQAQDRSPRAVRGFLLDTLVPGQAGGTGQTFPWRLARKAGEYGPVIVAGGLTPENVSEALAEARPFGVDVSSGVETDGIKDANKIRQFIEQVRRYN